MAKRKGPAPMYNASNDLARAIERTPHYGERAHATNARVLMAHALRINKEVAKATKSGKPVARKKQVLAETVFKFFVHYDGAIRSGEHGLDDLTAFASLFRE